MLLKSRVTFTIHNAEQCLHFLLPTRGPFPGNAIQFPHNTTNHLRRNVELEPDTHTRQLDIEILQHSGHRNGRHIVAAAEPDTLSIRPGVALALMPIGQLCAPPAANSQVPAARVLLARVLADSRGGGEEAATGSADGSLGVVRAVHQAVLKEEGRAV